MKKQLLCLWICISAVYSADVVTVDPSGVTTVTGVAPTTTPGSGEVKIGGGQIHVNAWLKLYGPLAAGRSSIIGHDGQGWFSQVSNDGDVQEFRNSAGTPLTINNHIKGNFITKGQVPTVAPGANEVAIGGGDVQIGRATQAVGAQVVRGDDQRINAGSIKAWVNFDGKSATVTIRGSFNVSSVERLGTGQYRVNFSTPFASASYVPIITCGPEAMTAYFSQAGALTTTSVSFVCINGPLALTNASIISVAVMGF